MTMFKKREQPRRKVFHRWEDGIVVVHPVWGSTSQELDEAEADLVREGHAEKGVVEVWTERLSDQGWRMVLAG